MTQQQVNAHNDAKDMMHFGLQRWAIEHCGDEKSTSAEFVRRHGRDLAWAAIDALLKTHQITRRRRR